MRGLVRALLAFSLVPVPVCLAQAAAPGPLRRLALVVGSNRGASDRVPLRYALADADRFAEIITRMGGVQAVDRIVLKDPTRKDLLAALAVTAARADSAKAATERVEVIIYFSGHADEQGVMLGRELLPYKELRSAIHSIGAQVGITILDACESGAITRLKGGQSRPAFLGNVASEVQGYAFLTSSSANEAAQESERLGGSFFTHALLTGLRGAADASGDGKVTLNEAYQFAFHETLVETTSTQAGAQHPAYDIRMAGTGEVVMTDLRQTSSSLILGGDYEGRFLVLSGRRELVAELYKPSGRTVELALEPAEYDVYFAQDQQLLKASIRLPEGQRYELSRAELKQAERLPTRLRGVDPGLTRPSRFGLRFTGRSFGAHDGLAFRPRWEFVYQPNDRLSFRPRVGLGWRVANVNFMLGANVAVHFRPGKTWRPYLSAGFNWEDREAPPPAPGPLKSPSDPTVWEPAPAEASRDLGYSSASVGLERSLSSRFSLVVEIDTVYPSDSQYEWRHNGTNWQSSWSGNPLGAGIGVTWSFGSRRP